MLVLGTTILIMQAVFMPVGMVYAETTMDTEEQELMELPPMKNYLEEEQISYPRFFFTRSRMQGTAEEPLQVTFFSDQEVSEARVFLPEEATLLKDQLPTGISVEEGAQPNEWIVQSKRVQNTFVLPLVVEQVGNYELSVEETTAHLEISEKEETSEEVPVEETESSDEDEAGQEELKEENGIDEEQENEQPAEEVREPVSEAPQEKQTDDAEANEESEVSEPTAFDGETAEVDTMAAFREAVANPDIGIISVQADLNETAANILVVDRPLLIQGNGHTLTFGTNGFYFQLEEMTEPTVFRIENATLTKFGVIPLINTTVESSKNWTVELEDITEVNANTMRLASLPEGNIHFTGGVSNFTRTTSTQIFIEAKEIVATNQAEVTISRGNATVFFSSVTVANPKVTVEHGATITITTASGTANTIDLRGENPEILLQGNGQLGVSTVGTTATPTDATNNTVALTGLAPKIAVNSGSRISITSTLAKRGIHLAGNDAQLLVNNSELSVASVTQAAINITGARSSFSSENSTIQLVSTTGITMNIVGESPQIAFDSSTVSLTSTTGQRMNLIGATPLVSLSHTEMNLNTSTGRGLYLQGATPQVLLDNSQLLMTDTGAAEGMILQGTDALLSLNNESELEITGAGTGTAENIRIGNTRPELSISGGSKLIVATESENNTGVNLSGSDSLLNLKDSEILINNHFNHSGMGGGINITDFSIFKSRSLYYEVSEFTVQNKSKVSITPNNISAGQVLFASNSTASTLLSIDDSELRVVRPFTEGTSSTYPVIMLEGGNSNLKVINGGKLYSENEGNGIPANGGTLGGNSTFRFRSGSNNIFTVSDRGSEIRLFSHYGTALEASYANTKFNIDINVLNQGVFSAEGNTRDNNSAIFDGSRINILFDNPLFLDFRNNRENGGLIFNVASNSNLNGVNSDLAVWRNGADLDGDPDLNLKKIDYSFTGANFNTLSGTSDPEQLNTAVFGTSGLSAYSRMSSNNGRWAIADELRVPTNADKKIHGRVSLPVGLDDSRPAWDDEAIVTVEVESPSGETTQEYTAKTVGDTNESPGISIYGEEPRGGLFEIDLEEPLEAGSKVRIIKVELTSGELTDGFEHQILTETVEVFPITPPTPAQFSSSIIAQGSSTIQGMTDNLDAEVTATHNGKPLNTEAITVEADGRFTLDLSEVSLEMEDEIQVFLRDAEGSAVAAGVVNPPETNNNRGNINPATELTFHDITFESATILIVGDLGPVSPVDPLDPEVEVDPENRPELPDDQGLLSIDFVSQFNFGSQSISANEQIYYANTQRLLNADGTVNKEEERPNYVQVSDRRSNDERNGWQLAVTQEEQFAGEKGQELAGAQLGLMNQQLVTAQGGDGPSLQVTNPINLIPGRKRTLIRAEGSEGKGTWVYRFGDAQTADKSVILTVPKGANPEAIKYSTTLTWELSAVPEN